MSSISPTTTAFFPKILECLNVDNVIKTVSTIATAILLIQVPYVAMIKGAVFLGLSCMIGVVGVKNPEIIKDLFTKARGQFQEFKQSK